MLKRFLFLISVPFILTAAVLAQQGSSAALNGVVKDAQGAVVPSATIIATELTTNIAKTTVTTGAGEYAIPAQPSGRYKITASHSGFSPAVMTGVDLSVAQLLTVDLKLEVGKASMTVTISGAASKTLETVSQP